MNDLEAFLHQACDPVTGWWLLSDALLRIERLESDLGESGLLSVGSSAASSSAPELEALAGSGRQLVAFVLDAEQGCLLPSAMLSTPSVAELRRLAHFASAMPRASLELAADPRFTLACTEDGHAAVVWWKDGVLVAELCQDRERLVACA